MKAGQAPRGTREDTRGNITYDLDASNNIKSLVVRNNRGSVVLSTREGTRGRAPRTKNLRAGDLKIGMVLLLDDGYPAAVAKVYPVASEPNLIWVEHGVGRGGGALGKKEAIRVLDLG